MGDSPAAAGAWEIDVGIVDVAGFFHVLPELFPEATHLYVEGSSLVPSAVACYQRHSEAGPFLPSRQTLWPSSMRLRCRASPALFGELAVLGEEHASVELVDHLCVYAGDRELIHWHDAFTNAMLLDEALPESTVAALATRFGCTYARATFPSRG